MQTLLCQLSEQGLAASPLTDPHTTAARPRTRVRVSKWTTFAEAAHTRLGSRVRDKTFIALTSIAMPAYADEADDLYHEGGALYDAGKYTESYPKLLKAWGLRKSPDIAGNLAQTEAKLGKFADAEQHLAYAIRTLPTSVPPEKRKAFQHAYDDMLSKIGTLRVRASVEGATIVVNDRKVGPVPLLDPVFVEPGHYVVSAELSGHEAKSATLEVQAGSAQDVLIELHEKEALVIVDKARSKPVWPYVVTAGGAWGLDLVLVFSWVRIRQLRICATK